MNDVFLRYLRDQVKKYKKEYSLNEGKAFGLWYAVDSLELEEDEGYEAVSFDGGNDKDIDLFYIDQESERVLIAQLKFNAKGQYKGRKNELLGLIHTTDWLKDSESLERDGRHDLAAAAKDYVDAIGRGFSVEYIYAYCGPPHKDVNDTARQFNVSEAGNMPSRSCRVVHLNSLIAEHDERINQSTRIGNAILKVLPSKVIRGKWWLRQSIRHYINRESTERTLLQPRGSSFRQKCPTLSGSAKGRSQRGHSGYDRFRK